MPYKANNSVIYKIRNKEGKYWQSGTYKWVKGGGIWKSIDGATAHITWLLKDGYYGKSRFNTKENHPVIVEFNVTEMKILDLKGNVKEDFTNISKIEPETIDELENI